VLAIVGIFVVGRRYSRDSPAVAGGLLVLAGLLVLFLLLWIVLGAACQFEDRCV